MPRAYVCQPDIGVFGRVGRDEGGKDAPPPSSAIWPCVRFVPPARDRQVTRLSSGDMHVASLLPGETSQ